MSSLGKPEILRRLLTGELVISPLLHKKQIGPSSVDLRMGTVVLMTKARGMACVDPKPEPDESSEYSVAMAKQQRFERHVLPPGRHFLLHPGALALVPTLEWLKLPPTLQGIVTARSTWAREGLNIATATIVNPGYIGTVTLELANFGPIPIRLYPGLRVAQIAFTRLGMRVPEIDLGSQFDLAFEPTGGNLAKDGDDVFTL